MQVLLEFVLRKSPQRFADFLTISAGAARSTSKVDVHAFLPLGELWAREKNDLFASALDEAVEDTVQATVQEEVARLMARYTSSAGPAGNDAVAWARNPQSPKAHTKFLYGQRATARQVQLASTPIDPKYQMNPKGLAAKQYGADARRLALQLYPQCRAADGKGDVPEMFRLHDADPANCVGPGARSCPWREKCRRAKDRSCPRHLVQDSLFAEHCQSGANG